MFPLVVLRNIHSDERFIGTPREEVLYLDEGIANISNLFWHEISSAVFPEVHQVSRAY